MEKIPFKKIICPTDFSEPSREALAVAAQLAEHFDAELLVLHVVPEVPKIPASPEGAATFNIPLYEQELRDASRKLLNEMVRQKVPRELRVRPVVAHGNTADQILQTAADEKADVIVIATHGRTGWQRFVFGSVAEKVVRLAPCAVLAVHGRQAREE